MDKGCEKVTNEQRYRRLLWVLLGIGIFLFFILILIYVYRIYKSSLLDCYSILSICFVFIYLIFNCIESNLVVGVNAAFFILIVMLNIIDIKEERG